MNFFSVSLVSEGVSDRFLHAEYENEIKIFPSPIVFEKFEFNFFLKIKNVYK